MSSQTDLDQGGTFRQLQRVYMGPSIGWQLGPLNVYLPILVAGTTQVYPGNSIVAVDVAGLVTVQLPSAVGNTAGAGVVPGTWIPTPITIADVGGNATNFDITILPYAGETIAGLASLILDSAFGVYTLTPDLASGGWTFK